MRRVPRLSVYVDGAQLHLEPGQTVLPHGPDRNLTVDEILRPANDDQRVP
jgi:hypothetical protein